jgi:hypothetical protein
MSTNTLFTEAGSNTLTVDPSINYIFEKALNIICVENYSILKCKADCVVDIYRHWKKFALLTVGIKIFFSHEGGIRYFRIKVCKFLPGYKVLNPRIRWATVLNSTRTLLNEYLFITNSYKKEEEEKKRIRSRLTQIPSAV